MDARSGEGQRIGVRETTGRSIERGGMVIAGGYNRVLCRYCGTDNPGVHRFCGMCGKPLDEEPAVESSALRKDSHASILAPMEPVESPAERPTPAPAYTGGIFNLGAPSDSSSGNADYLLEDDEPRSGKGLLLFGLLAVALAVGLGWMRFRQTGIPGLKGLIGSSSPTATNNAPAPSQAPADGSAPAGTAPAGTAPAPAGSEPPPSSTATQTPAPTPGASPQTEGNPPASASGTAPPSTPPPTAAAPSTAAPPGSESPANGSAPPAATTDHDPAGSKDGEQTGEAASAATPATTTPAANAPSGTAPPAAADPDVPAAAKPKKLPKPAAAKPEDTVALGEKYLYGRGVPQSCEKGLRYVKPAAEQSNPKAMITMGALYATGHCLSRDLPTAYRYFALALRQDPGNGALKQNAEMVWGQMTQSERQLAIRLTQ
jgi:hypothetical protein